MTAIALLQSAGPGGALGAIAPFIPIAGIFLVFYFLVIAPANKQRRKTQDMLGSLKKGDVVLTSGGIYGTIQGVEAEVVYLRIADNLKIKVARSAVTSIVTSGSE